MDIYIFPLLTFGFNYLINQSSGFLKTWILTKVWSACAVRSAQGSPLVTQYSTSSTIRYYHTICRGGYLEINIIQYRTENMGDRGYRVWWEPYNMKKTSFNLIFFLLHSPLNFHFNVFFQIFLTSMSPLWTIINYTALYQSLEVEFWSA